jgi:hypothetical protein
MHLLRILVSLLISPFRSNVKFECAPILREETEILKDNIRNVTYIVKKNIENKLEESAIEKIKTLNNQLEWLRKNLNNE